MPKRSSPDYTHILFDHDGVLVDTEPLYFEATQIKLAELGVEFSEEDYLRLQAGGHNAWQDALDYGHTQAKIDAKRAERNVLYQEFLTTRDIDIDGVEEVLAELAQTFGMAIVTTAKRDDFELIHAHRNIVPHMRFVLAQGDYARSKPQPDPYVAALERFGVAPQRTLVVEDSERGLRAAVAARIDCAIVHHPFTASQDFGLATYRLGALTDLLELLGC